VSKFFQESSKSGVVLALVGPSSVGKSAIVEKNENLDSQKLPHDQKQWKVEGVDNASMRKFGELNDVYKSELEGNSNFEALMSKDPEFRDGHIFHII